MKANEVKNFGQLEEFLNEKSKGQEIRYSVWWGFSQLEDMMREIDEHFDIRRERHQRTNEQQRKLYYGDLCLGYISFKKTADRKFKEVSLACVGKDKSWLDAVSADEKRKSDEEAKATELLKEHGFKDLDDLVAYLRKFPKSKIKDIKSDVY